MFCLYQEAEECASESRRNEDSYGGMLLTTTQLIILHHSPSYTISTLCSRSLLSTVIFFTRCGNVVLKDPENILYSAISSISIPLFNCPCDLKYDCDFKYHFCGFFNTNLYRP